MVPGQQEEVRRTCQGARHPLYYRLWADPKRDQPPFPCRPPARGRFALSNIPGHSLFKGQAALQNQHGYPVPPRTGKGRSRSRILSAPGTESCLRGRRHLAPRFGGTGKDPRRHGGRPVRLETGRRDGTFQEQILLDRSLPCQGAAGLDPDHPLIEDLRRKDFMGTASLTQDAVGKPEFPQQFGELCREGTSLVRFLCGALGLPF